MKFAFITENKVAFPITVLCRVLEVPSSGYYASKTRPAAAKGGPAARASTPSFARTARRLVESGLRGLCARVASPAACDARFRATTDSDYAFPIAAKVLARDFTAVAPNEVWATDITAIPTQQGWLDLAAILDLFSRRIGRWATSENVDRHLALSALDMARDSVFADGPSPRGRFGRAGDGLVRAVVSHKSAPFDANVADPMGDAVLRGDPDPPGNAGP